MNALQKNFLKNDLDAKAIKNEAELVRESANNAHEDATKVSFFFILEKCVLIKLFIEHLVEKCISNGK